MRRLMLEHHLTTRFPEAVERESAAFGPAPREQDTAGRRDLRDLPLVTIDGETAKDFDDAVCAVRHGNDGYTLYVAIADVSHYVRAKSALDEEAFSRGTSTYLTDRAIPMLPEALSNGLCSLMPHVDRLCVVAELTLDRTGHVEKTTFYDAVMRSHARLTYTRVAKALEGEPDEECQRLLPTILLLAKVAALFLERRLKRGAIDLDLAEPYVVYDENHFPTDIKKRERNDAHRLIEDLMLAANEAVASFFVERSLCSVFRIHEDPDPEKLQTFVAMCAHLGVHAKIKRHPQPKDVSLLLEKLSENEVGKTLNPLLLRSLMQARYDADCKGHYGLAAERYLHFTSPIRRYPDLIVHRLLKRVLAAGELGYSRDELQEISQHSSEAERRAMLAERASMDLDRAYVALEHLGEAFQARITSVAPFGIFASVDQPFIEGMIPVAMLGGDDFEIDEYNIRLTGAFTGRMFMIGQTIEVEIASVNIARRQVELKLVGVEPRARDDDDERPRRRRELNRGERPPAKHRGADRSKKKHAGGRSPRKKHRRT
jgi:ribonuclease R